MLYDVIFDLGYARYPQNPKPQGVISLICLINLINEYKQTLNEHEQTYKLPYFYMYHPVNFPIIVNH